MVLCTSSPGEWRARDHPNRSECLINLVLDNLTRTVLFTFIRLELHTYNGRTPRISLLSVSDFRFSNMRFYSRIPEMKRQNY